MSIASFRHILEREKLALDLQGQPRMLSTDANRMHAAAPCEDEAATSMPPLSIFCCNSRGS